MSVRWNNLHLTVFCIFCATTRREILQHGDKAKNLPLKHQFNLSYFKAVQFVSFSVFGVNDNIAESLCLSIFWLEYVF